MTPELLAAHQGLRRAAQRLSDATNGKGGRDSLPKPVREALAGLDGALARIRAEERRG